MNVNKLHHEWKKRSPALDDPSFLESSGVKINKVTRLKLETLQESFPKEDAKISNYLINNKVYRFVRDDELILSHIIRHEKNPPTSSSFVRAGPREKLFFDPTQVIAGIVTCGGLSPGLNNVIRELVRSLHNMYGVKKVWGFVGGYGGVYGKDPVELTLKSVEGIQHKGGTILSSNRGGFDEQKIHKSLENLGVNMFIVIGGDGTMRGAERLHRYLVQQKYLCSISAVPKTIDNDLDIIDNSFGFSTAVTKALNSIACAKTEAECVPNGVGIVKLMGRHAGFIALHATMASGDVDCCLIPEADIDLEDSERGVLPHIFDCVKRNGHAVVVVAEGAGEELLGEATTTDAGGNRKLPQIGRFLREEVTKYFKKQGQESSVKYIDPSYMIRSVKANATDAIMCLILAQNCVHAAMAGKTGFTVGIVNNRTCLLPMNAITQNSPRRVDINGRTYDRMLAITGQPRSKGMTRVTRKS